MVSTVVKVDLNHYLLFIPKIIFRCLEWCLRRFQSLASHFEICQVGDPSPSTVFPLQQNLPSVYRSYNVHFAGLLISEPVSFFDDDIVVFLGLRSVHITAIECHFLLIWIGLANQSCYWVIEKKPQEAHTPLEGLNGYLWLSPLMAVSKRLRLGC